MCWHQDPATVYLSIQCDTAVLELQPRDLTVSLTENDLAVEVTKLFRVKKL